MGMLKNTCCHKSQPDPTFKDESDQATLRQTLPDLTPDDPSDAPALPTEEDLAPTATVNAEEADGEAAGDAPDNPTAGGDAGSDESPNKSPSKKKKKFRTPSFLKKNKKKEES